MKNTPLIGPAGMLSELFARTLEEASTVKLLFTGIAGCGKTSLANQIAAPQNGLRIDHKDRDKLNNCRDNLRYATHAQNNANALKKPGASGYTGVVFRKSRWEARASITGKNTFLGSFGTADEAAHAYDSTVRKYRGEFAVTNFPLVQNQPAAPADQNGKPK